MVILFSNNEIVVIKTQLILKSANKFNDSKYFFVFSKRKIKDGCTFITIYLIYRKLTHQKDREI